jgi:hypothetical protein
MQVCITTTLSYAHTLFLSFSYKELKLARWRKLGKSVPEGTTPSDAVTIRTLLSGGTPFYSFYEFFSIVAGPYLLIHFFLFPLPLLFIGEYLGVGHEMYFTAVKNLFYAELLTNAHAFLAIVTNHAGNDMYRFRDGCRPYSGSFYLRQVLASVDFWTGSDINDFLHGYLNYQIEHHLVSCCLDRLVIYFLAPFKYVEPTYTLFLNTVAIAKHAILQTIPTPRQGPVQKAWSTLRSRKCIPATQKDRGYHDRFFQYALVPRGYGEEVAGERCRGGGCEEG